MIINTQLPGYKTFDIVANTETHFYKPSLIKDLFTLKDETMKEACPFDSFASEKYMRNYKKTEKTETCICEDLEDSLIYNKAGIDLK